MLGIGRAGPLGADASPGAAEASPGHSPDAVPTERELWAIVASAKGIGPATIEALITALGSPAAILDVAGRDDALGRLAPIIGGRRAGEAAAALVDAAREASSTVDRLRASAVSIVTVDDEDYPASLRGIDARPPVLFVSGPRAVVGAQPAVAVVGTRRPSEAGRRLAADIAGALAACDATVVSGLAVGIDGAAHAAAVEAGGRTIAVLGGGHDELFPRAHRRLRDEILARGGAVVSEVPPWAQPAKALFPQRNRIISGLAGATVVVEAGHGSGALITARHALAQGRGCHLVPGAIGAATSAGCLAFLRENAEARIVAGIPELLVDLGLVGERRGRGRRTVRGEAALAATGSVEREVGRLISAGVGTVDALVDALELPVATILAAITLLETRGLIVDALGRYRAAGELARRGRPARRPSHA